MKRSFEQRENSEKTRLRRPGQSEPRRKQGGGFLKPRSAGSAPRQEKRAASRARTGVVGCNISRSRLRSGVTREAVARSEPHLPEGGEGRGPGIKRLFDCSARKTSEYEQPIASKWPHLHSAGAADGREADGMCSALQRSEPASDHMVAPHQPDLPRTARLSVRLRQHRPHPLPVHRPLRRQAAPGAGGVARQ